MSLVIANILGFLGTLCYSFSTYCKTKKKILIMESIDDLLNIFSFLLVGGFAGVITHFIELLRHY